MSAPDTQPGYAWHLVIRTEVPDSDRDDTLSRDSEVERLSSADVLGIEVLQAPMTREEAAEKSRLPGRRIVEGGYVEAYSVTPGLAMHEVQKVTNPSTGRRLRGLNVNVAVLDTGLDSRYLPGFSQYMGESFVAGERWDSDPNGHGSHVAGTIAHSTTYAGLTIGIAPRAQVLAYKVLSDSGSGSYAAIIKALELAVQRGADAINLSLGGPGDKDHPLSLAVDAAARSAVVCVAAGNEQRGSSTYLADSSTPASARDAVTVGAVDSARKRAAFSNIGESVDIAAHGVNVPSLGGSMSGTSMASPHVAGVAALLMESGRTPQQVKQALLSGAVNTSLSVVEEGYGVLDAPGALERLTGTPRTSKGLAAHMSACMKQCWRSWRQREKV